MRAKGEPRLQKNHIGPVVWVSCWAVTWVSVAASMSVAASVSVAAAAPRSRPVAVEKTDAVQVIAHQGTRVVVSGAQVARWPLAMPVWCFEAAGDKPGLQLFEAQVASINGDQAALHVVETQAGLVQIGAICEPRFVAESRRWNASVMKLQADSPAGAATPAPAVPAVTVRHRPPVNVAWGKPIWLEAVLDGPADSVLLYLRQGATGPYREWPMAAKGDGLYGISVTLEERDPPDSQVQYYLIAQGPGAASSAPPLRYAVFANPAEPQTIGLDAVPEQTREQLVAHGPTDRASHGKPLELVAQINKRFTSPTIFYRARGSGTYRALPMKPMGPEQWQAVVPARDVVVPGLAYYIAVMDEKGVVREGFASQRYPHTVTVLQPQILSEEENRNRLTMRYGYSDFGTAGDTFHQGEASLERLFFGFLIARLSAAGWWGDSQRRAVIAGPDSAKPVSLLQSQPMRLYVGRAGLDLHLGDYVAASVDLSMATYKGGSGLGYRAVMHIGDEHVASIELGIEQVWPVDTGEKLLDIKRGTLLVPLGDRWRLAASAAQEQVLTDAPKAIRLGVGVEVDLGNQLQLDLSGGAAGRLDQLGPTVNTGFRFKF